MRTLRALPAALFMLAAFPLAERAAAQSPPATPVIDLGERQQDQIYPITLVAQNLNCKTPQDFRFDLSAAPFLVAQNDPVARQVPAGGEKTIPARIVTSLGQPGEQTAIVTTICETCRPTPLFGNNCRADKNQVLIRVVILPPQPQQPHQPQQPQQPQPGPQAPQPDDDFLSFEMPAPPPPGAGAGLAPRCDVDVADMGYFQSAPAPAFLLALEGFLLGGQKRALDEARRRAASAAEAARVAQEELGTLRRKKRDCEDELAALRAEQAVAEAAAKAAEAAAAAAQKAVAGGPEKKAADAAQKAVDSFQRDVDKAQAEYDRWTEAAQRQQNYLELVIAEEGGLSSRRGQNAKKFYEDADKKRDAARENLARTKNSMAERQAKLAEAQAALAAAQAAADAKNAEAAAARAAADAAKEAADAKARECLGLDAQEKAQTKAAADAAKTAADAEKDSTRAEQAAAAQARKNLDEAIACKKDECERIRRKWDEHFRRLSNAKKALDRLGYFKPPAAASAGAIAASAAQQPPDSLWKDYLKLGLDKFLEAAGAVAGQRYPGRYVPGTGVTVVLDILQAAYGIAGIYQSALRPGTYAHGRTEGATLHGWLQRNNFAHTDRGDADAKEVEKQMERLMKDPGVIAKDLDQAIREMEKCKEELAALEARKAAS